jgi:hypothetical protein
VSFDLFTPWVQEHSFVSQESKRSRADTPGRRRRAGKNPARKSARRGASLLSVRSNLFEHRAPRTRPETMDTQQYRNKPAPEERSECQAGADALSQVLRLFDPPGTMLKRKNPPRNEGGRANASNRDDGFPPTLA